MVNDEIIDATSEILASFWVEKKLDDLLRTESTRLLFIFSKSRERNWPEDESPAADAVRTE